MTMVAWEELFTLLASDLTLPGIVIASIDSEAALDLAGHSLFVVRALGAFKIGDLRMEWSSMCRETSPLLTLEC